MDDENWAPLHIDWRGGPLQPEGSRAFGDGLNRIGLDGTAYMMNGRLILTTGRPFTMRPFDRQVIDTRTGFFVASRGTGTPRLMSSTSPTIVIDDYEVVFGDRWLNAYGGLWTGGVLLWAMPPRSLRRFLRRARGRGAVDFGNGLLLCR